jgi:hypothetical protein
MRLIWKIAVPVACVAAIAGTLFALRLHRHNAEATKIAEELRVARIGAEQGNAVAEYNLARLYYAGRGVPQSYAEAFRWYSKAADQGHPKAEFAVGAMYAAGRGAQQNDAEAFVWVRKAAEQGEPRAQDELGMMYYYGRGVQHDHDEAMRWFRRSADQGYVWAQDDLAGMYYNGLSVPQDYAEAARWYRKAADQGNARAEYDLGYMDRYGKGIPVNLAEARRLIREAAVQGDKRALLVTRESLTEVIKIFLLIELVAGLFFAVGLVRFRTNSFADPSPPRTRNQKLTGVAGALLLLSVGYSWYGYTHLKFPHLIYGVNAWMLCHWLFEAAPIALLLYSVRLDRQRQLEDGGDDSSFTNDMPV